MLVGMKLLKYVKETLINIDIIYTEKFLWSDIEITLSWVVSKRSDNVYVRNRVSETNELVPDVRVMYVRTDQNPADFVQED